MQALVAKCIQYISSLQIHPVNILEILILTVLLYYIFVWIKNSRTWFLFRGIAVLLVFVVLANLLQLNVIVFLAERTLSVLLIALLVIFQPELRAALETLGQRNSLAKMLTRGRARLIHGGFDAHVTEELVKACEVMSRNRTGALIVIERELPLDDFAKTGIALDSLVSAALLINIFEKNTPLHDGAVILRGKRLASATCYLPLSANLNINKNLGTRHRAAIGISEHSDSVTLVVSEETGSISVAEHGRLKHGITLKELREILDALEDNEEKRPVWGVSRAARRRKTENDVNPTETEDASAPELPEAEQTEGGAEDA